MLINLYQVKNTTEQRQEEDYGEQQGGPPLEGGISDHVGDGQRRRAVGVGSSRSSNKG